MTSNATSIPTLGRIAFDAYGSHPGPFGKWATFDGRPVPTWDELNADSGKLTQERWEIGVARRPSPGTSAARRPCPRSTWPG